jgi:hypothetical protein
MIIRGGGFVDNSKKICIKAILITKKMPIIQAIFMLLIIKIIYKVEINLLTITVDNLRLIHSLCG